MWQVERVQSNYCFIKTHRHCWMLDLCVCIAHRCRICSFASKTAIVQYWCNLPCWSVVHSWNVVPLCVSGECGVATTMSGRNYKCLVCLLTQDFSTPAGPSVTTVLRQAGLCDGCWAQLYNLDNLKVSRFRFALQFSFDFFLWLKRAEQCALFLCSDINSIKKTCSLFAKRAFLRKYCHVP